MIAGTARKPWRARHVYQVSDGLLFLPSEASDQAAAIATPAAAGAVLDRQSRHLNEVTRVLRRVRLPVSIGHEAVAVLNIVGGMLPSGSFGDSTAKPCALQ